MSVAKTVAIFLTCAVALAACGKPEPVASPAVVQSASAARVAFAGAPPVVPVPATPVAPEQVAGKLVFDKTCGLCHGAGTGGSPRPGDKANWAPRIAQGMDVLYEHARVGYNGEYGYMPARGGASATDSEIKAGVDYMVSLSR